jgi:hypothetical protein
MTIDELINCELWFEGPPFLKLAKEEWPVITRKLTPEEQKVIDDKVVNFALNIHVNEKDYTRSHNKNSGNFYNKLHHKINNEEFWWKRIKLEHHFENKSFEVPLIHNSINQTEIQIGTSKPIICMMI